MGRSLSRTVRSMTGFGTGDAKLGDSGRVLAEVRSVNGRFLDVRARLPRELGELSMFAEHVVRERMRRGRVEVSVRTEGAAPTGRLDVERARTAWKMLETLRDELSPGADLPLSLLSAVPELFATADGDHWEQTRRAVRKAIVAAIEELEKMSLREGEKLADDLLARASLLRTYSEQASARAEEIPALVRKKLTDRVRQVGSDAERVVNAERLEAEIVMLAERADVTEELTRLRVHVDHFESILRPTTSETGSEPSGPVGRRLDFLLQEMGREVNTLSAKAQDASVSRDVVSMKVELERMREQVQNVE